MTVKVLPLGCKVNQYDAAAAQTALAAAGHTLVSDGPAEVCVVFTCTVTAEARRKSLQALRRAAAQSGMVVAAGCVAQTEGAALLALPKVRLAVGASRRAQWPELIARAMREPLCVVEPADTLCVFENTPVAHAFGERTRAHIKVQEGCDNHCAYCIVPQARGPERSRGLLDIRAEAEALAKAGCAEAVLVGINLSAYGRERGHTLADAVQAVADTGILRIRLGSMEADSITPQLVERLQKIPALCPHFHLPLQSASPRVQQTMGRICGAKQVGAAMDALRQAFPACGIQTDCMVAFPGETHEEFLQTVAFCQEKAFSRLHVFAYSPRPGTVAAKLPDRIPPDVAKARVKHLIGEGQSLRAAYEAKWIGQTTEVLWETAQRGHTPQGILVFAKPGERDVCGVTAGTPETVRLTGTHPEGLWAGMDKS